MVNKNSKTSVQTNHKNEKLWPIFLWCLSYLRPHRKRFILFVGTGILFTLALLMIPKMIQFFIDYIQHEGELSLLIGLLSIVVCILLVMYLGQAAHVILQRKIQEEVSRDLQYDLFTKLRHLGFSYYEKHPVGESLSLMNTEVTAVQKFYTNKFPASIRYFIFSVISFMIMTSLSWHLTLIMLPCLALYYLVGPYFEKKATNAANKVSEKRVDYNRKVYESVSALTELRANDSGQWDQKKLLHKLTLLNKSLLLSDFYALSRGSVRRLTYYIGAIVIFILGPYLVIHNMLTIGAFVAFILYYFEVMQRLTVFITLITDQRLIMIQARKLYNLMNVEPEVEEIKNPVDKELLKGDIEFKNVSFVYEEGSAILQDFSFKIPYGQRIAFVGASGSGKSTLLKLLARFYDTNSGDILIDGIPITQLSFRLLRNSIGYVFQESYLFGASVRENILFGNPNATEEQIVEAATAAHAHDFIMELPQGYDTKIGERGIKLSGGQKQRIAIARVMIKNPQIILLDEATSALDTITELEVKQALENLFKGRTTIAVAHRLSTIKEYDQIVFLDNGSPSEIGTYAELMSRKGLFYHLSTGEEMQEVKQA